MEIKVIGRGCANCKRLHENALEAVKGMPEAPTVEYVTDLREIARLGVMTTPALMVDGKIRIAGRVPGAEEIRKLVGGGSGAA